MAKDLKLTITKELRELIYVKTEVSTYLDVNYVSSAVSYKVNMVIEQVVEGIINNAAEDEKKFTIRLYLGIRGRELQLEVVWRGHAYNPVVGIRAVDSEPLEEMNDHELGTHVVRKLTKSARFARKREENENHLMITMRSGLHS